MLYSGKKTPGPLRSEEGRKKKTLSMQMTRQEKLNYIANSYMKAMWAKAYSVISDAHEAEDACQEAFIKIIRIIDQIEDVTEARSRALCCMIARNTAIDMARKNGRAAPTEDIYMELDAPVPEKDGPESIAESKEGVEQLAALIEELPEGYREVLRLRCLYEMSAEQAADILGINANTVNIRLSRARKLLKDRLDALQGRNLGG